MHNCNQQRPPVVRRGKQPPPRSKEPAPASNPMLPPARPIPRPASHHVAATFNSSRNRSRACGDRWAGPSGATGKHDRPAQAKRIAGTGVSPANRPRLCRVHHVAEPRAPPPRLNCRQRAPVVSRGKQPPPPSNERTSAPSPMPPPAGSTPRRVSDYVATAFAQ